MAKCKDCIFLHSDGHCGAWLSNDVKMLIPFANMINEVENICSQFRKKTEVQE